jgi:hypothetical protein
LWPANILSVGSSGVSIPLIAENNHFPVTIPDHGIAVLPSGRSTKVSVSSIAENFLFPVTMPEGSDIVLNQSAPSALKAAAHHGNLTSSIFSTTLIATHCSLSVQPLSGLSVPILQGTAQDSTIADVFTQYGEAIQSNIGSFSSSISLGTIYPEFESCKSMTAVIQLSSELAPCSFDIDKAQAAHRLDPKSLNSDILEADLLYAKTYGLQSLLTTRFKDAEKITLQPAIVSSDFQSVITFKNLQAVAVNGVITETHPSFIPNLGVDCPRNCGS